jgi:aminotransferase
MPRQETAKRTHGFTESVIREMTRLAHEHDAVNLSQGFPDFPAPDAVKEAACEAIVDDVNQYAVTWGAPSLRQAIARKFTALHGVAVDPDTQVTVCCGSTEAMVSTLLAAVDPGDEVIVFEPFYENYGPDAILSGATPRYVTLREPDWTFDPEELASAFGNRTKAIIINTPNNPTGKVFSHDELVTIGRLCQQWGTLAITDEIYEHIVYDGDRHVPMAAVEGMANRTVTINSLSKTYSVTGWRVGWAIAPAWLTAGIRKVHDFLTVGAAAPLQAAGVAALALPDGFYTELAAGYQRRRDVLLEILERHGFTCYRPHGAYYIMTDISRFGADDDVRFTTSLVKDVGVAAVPGSSFYHEPSLGRTKVRFCFCKRDETLREADTRLARLQVPTQLEA